MVDSNQCRFILEDGFRCSRVAYAFDYGERPYFCFQHVQIILRLAEQPSHIVEPEWVMVKLAEYEELTAELSEARQLLNQSKEKIRRGWRNRSISPATRAGIIERDTGRCRYCGIEVDARSAHLDHYEPDGPTDASNLVTSCQSCNSRKGKIRPRQLFRLRGMKLIGKSVQQVPSRMH